MVDFHIHTTCTDGMLTPDQVVHKAMDSGLRAIALTDHNFINEELGELRERYRTRIQLVNGMELSTTYTASDGSRKEVHIVALDFDNAPLRSLVAQNQPDRAGYINAICERLRACGLDMPLYEGLKKAYPRHRRMSRLQIADYMWKHGFSRTIDGAFDEYIGARGKRRAYVDSLDYADYIPLQDGVSAIRDAGGIPVLAHLFKYGYSERENMRLIQMFKEAAGKNAAMEVYYGRYPKEKQERLRRLAEEWNLYWSSGSDFHGRTADEKLMPTGHLAECPMGRHVATLLERRGDLRHLL